MKHFKVSLSLMLLCATFGSASKILTILPTTFKSHWIIGGSVIKPLVKAGHEITLISPFRLDEPNVTNIVLSNLPDGKCIADLNL